MNVLVIAAHPDDEVLGCGGAIIKHVRRRDEVHIRILTDGATGRGNEALRETLRENAISCCEKLGATSLKFSDLPNQRLDAVPVMDIILPIEAYISDLKPDRVYTHHVGDLNVDHQRTHLATMTATRPLSGACVKEVYSYCVPSSTEWYQTRPENVFIPNVFIDIKDVVDQKIEAMESYETECRPYPHPRSPESLRARTHAWGLSVGLEYAEPFTMVRSLREAP